MSKSKRETIVQQELISYCNFLQNGFVKGLDPVPELEVLHHIVNEGKRSPAEGAKLVREGLKSGIPDLSLPVRSYCGNYNSLYIELKRESGGILSESQISMISALRSYGNRVRVYRSSRKALRAILSHLGRWDIVKVIDEDFNRIKNPI